jgi:pyrroloquinoline quinone (PQQ) biosynthesis protein C
MAGDKFWTDLRTEIEAKPLTAHPIYKDTVRGKLKRETLAELCAQFKYTVIDGIGSLALIIPQAPLELKKELAGNLFGELHGTRREPSHWELALRTGAAAVKSKQSYIDKKPILPETKIYPDTVSAYAVRGMWLEALSFVALGIEDLFHPFCAGMTKGLKKHYGFNDEEALYFSAHVGADEAHGETGWQAVRQYARPDQKHSIRIAALEGRNMWWNMYSAVYNKFESKAAPYLKRPV